MSNVAFASRMRPVVVVVSGPPGSGKSTISKALQDRLVSRRFLRFEMDELRLSLWPNLNTSEDRARAYARMHELAANAIQGGAEGVILDATYQPAQQRHAIQVLSDWIGADVLIIECKTDPDVVVNRFEERGASHAATDLSAERVWDLAFEFPYVEGGADGIILVDTTQINTSESVGELVETLVRQIRGARASADLRKWIGKANMPQPGPQEQPRVTKLTEISRKDAQRSLGSAKRVVWSVRISASITVLIALKVLADLIWPNLGRVGFPGRPEEWVVVWAALAGLWAAYVVARQYFLESPKAKTDRDVVAAGRVPRIVLSSQPPSNVELYSRYWRRLRDDEQRSRMLVPNVPLWFVVKPRAKGFDVLIDRTSDRLIEEDLLVERAARLGLDWEGFAKWGEKERQDEYYGQYHETNVRALKLVEHERQNHVTLTACRGSFKSYVKTELAANLGVAGRQGFAVREILEGRGWRQWDPRDRCSTPDFGEPCTSCKTGRCHALRMGDLSAAAKTHEMLVGVQVGLTTDDGFLILQRRSNSVQTATGGVTSSGAGSSKWDDFLNWRNPKLWFSSSPWRNPKLWFNRSLVQSALREIHEEIAWEPGEGDETAEPFLGAAFNLLRGRDLNFYCHFHTGRKLKEVAEHAMDARDSWEVAHLIPVPVKAVMEGGQLEPRFQSLVGDGRHVRGLLHCLDQSEKFRRIRDSS